jgi:Putative Ig domain/Carboxypeptidase regulatory-like domain
MRAALAFLAALLILGVSAAEASATNLTFEANGSPLTTGSIVEGSSSLLTLSTNEGSVECQENVLVAELEVFKPEEVLASLQSETSTGPGGSPCNAGGGKQAYIRAYQTPSRITLKPGSLFMLVYLEVENIGGPTCSFVGKVAKGRYNIGGQMIAKFSREKLKSISNTPGCGKKLAELTGSFAFASGGHPVEAVYGAPASVTLKGDVSDGNGAVDNVEIEACNETTLTCYTALTAGIAGEYSTSVPAGNYEVTATPPAGNGDAGAVEYEVAATANPTTYNVTLPPAATVKGTITEQSNNGIPGIAVSVCGQACYQAVTNGAGEYSVTVPAGTYEIEGSPPFGYEYIEGEVFTIAAAGTHTEDFTLEAPTPPPAGTKVEGIATAQYNGHEIPIVDWEAATPITTQACVGGTVEVAVEGVSVISHTTVTSSPVTLTQGPPGTFTGDLPTLYPIHGEGTVKMTVTNCGAGNGTTAFTVYIDPSGTVVDGDNGDAPLAGATVTLLAGPKRTGPFTAVPSGSTVMSPGNRVNPDTTNALGEFGWDTTPGFYEIEASEAGCGKAVDGPFEVPPPQVGLRLVLHCTVRIQTTSLPEATLGQPYSVTLTASGVETPFKWKKLAPLPKGLKLSKTGVLSGTMKASKVSPNTYPIEVQVTNHAKESAKATLELKVG